MTTHNPNQTLNNQQNNKKKPIIVHLPPEQNAGHADHWRILTDNLNQDIPLWLQQMINQATLPKGLHPEPSLEPSNNTHNTPIPSTHLLLSENNPCHINQILAMKDGKPERFINAFPCINSPYGLTCQIERIITDKHTNDTVLRLQAEDSTIIYAFDQLYTINQTHYQANTAYFVNLSAWAYQITPSQKDEVVRVEDQEAIRYHRAFNDIIAENNGKVPDDIQEQIKQWQPDTDQPLAPVEINLGHMCAYLFGDTLGQEDEAWCQGQVLGKSETTFYGQKISLFDVVILREQDAKPFVIRIATPTNTDNSQIQVHDYIQANIWLQAAIYQENQTDNKTQKSKN